MAYGLRCWDAQGNVVLDVTDRITRYLGMKDFDANTPTDGSIAVPVLAGATYFMHYTPYVEDNNKGLLFDLDLDLKYSNGQISWSGFNKKTLGYLIYGVY